VKYFIKYLPVEGEINEGDKFLDHTDNLIKDAHIPEIYNNPHVPYFDGYKKVKLFLCSRDIQKTDKEIYVHKPDGSEATKVELIDIISDKEITAVMFKWGEQTPGTLIQNTFKVIGEISPEAKWVKEGDEFDEEEIEWICDSGDEQRISIWSLRELAKNDGEKFIFPNGGTYAVKGPCGHFH